MRPTIDPRPEDRAAELALEDARHAAATRRAVVLGILTLALLAALVLAIVAVVPRWAPALATVPVVAFVLATALTASARSSARPQRASAPVRRRPATRRPEAAAPAAADAVEDDWETWNAWDDDDSSWEAVPTTLPTYVTAPRASAVPRGIDRSRPGEWTGSAMVETARAMRARPGTPAMAAEPIDHVAMTAEIPRVADDVEHRRAVNE